MVPPVQIVTSPPLTEGLGSATTVTDEVGSDEQLLEVCVNLKVEVPAATPVTMPALETVATEALLETHVPPVAGDKVVVPPTQMVLSPVIETTGFTSMVAFPVGLDAQPVAVDVNVKFTEPAATAVTTPALLTVAMALLLLVQVPPEEGDKVVLSPIHKIEEPT